MTPNKLPPLPERVALTKLFAPWFIASLGDLTDDYAAMTLDDVEMALLANGEYILPIIEALRQSQSLPAGAVAPCRHEAFQGRCVHCDVEFRNGQPAPAELTGRGLMMAHEAKHGPTIRDALQADDDAGQREYDKEILSNLEQLLRPRKWLGRWDEIVRQVLAEYDALQADAREKGEAVFRLYPEELARMTHGPSLRAEEEDRLRSIYGDVAIPLYLHSGDYTEAMLLLEKQRELVENLRGQLDDAKADATDGCTEANCERCNTAIHSRGDMRHAGIGTYPATQPAQASEKAPSDDYQRGFHDGYERRHLEVLGALV